MSGEFERIARLAARFGTPPPGTVIGIGDDAAVLTPTASPLVWTIDAQVDGTHFRLDWLDWEDVGYRSFMAAASDLAAMGAAPLAALSALCLADEVDDEALDRLAKGQADAARAVGAAVVGGNLARGRETSVTTTLLGHCPKPLLRSGARPGDGVFVAGELGEAAAGLAALMSGRRDAATETCIATWRRPRARMAEGLALRDVATAALDVSDGLSQDAGHLAESSAVTITFEEAALRSVASPALEAAAAAVGRDVLGLMLEGGEDYALLVTTAVDGIPGFRRIGRVEAGAAHVILERADGTRTSVDPRGFDHFAPK